jgi:hypothetical protein
VHGIWRIVGDTRDTQLVITEKEWTVNDSLLRNYGVINASMAVQSSLYIKVEVIDKPYWLLNIEHVGDYLVTPKMSGTRKCFGITQWIEHDTRQGAVVEPVYASIYRVSATPKVLVIPFAVTAIKKTYNGDIMLETNFEYAKKDEANKRWIIVIEGDLAKYDSPSVIEFHNPNNLNENFTLDLTHYTGLFGPYASLGAVENGFLIVTEQGIEFVQNNYNTFVNDLTDLERIINWYSQNEWKYANYWFGGDSIFQGTTSVLSEYMGIEEWKGQLAKWVDNTEYNGTSTGCVWHEVNCDPLMEGYWAEGTYNGRYEYPGWYKPYSTSEPNAINITDSDWYNRVFPIRPNVLTDQKTLPYGLSLVNYMADKSVTSPVTGKKKGDVGIVVDRINIDLFGEGYAASLSSGKYKVYCPRNSWHWGFNIDISSELVDTIYVVNEPHSKPKINSFIYTTEKIVPGIDYYITATITNEGNSGDVGIGLNIDGAPFEVKSGTGWVYMNNSQTINRTITFRNLGTLSKDTYFTLRLFVGNKYEITDYKDFNVLAGAGVGVEKTSVTVTCIDSVDKYKVNGLNVEVREKYGKFDYTQTTGTSGDGTALFDLGQFEGTVLVTVSDPANVYLKTNSTEYYVKAGSNPIIVTVYKTPLGPGLWELLQQYMPYIVGGVIGAVGICVGAYALKRRAEVRW